jgi:hypothetical protein
MDRGATFLLAMGMLIAAGIAVSAAGWTLFVRDRRAHRPALAGDAVSGEDRTPDRSDPDASSDPNHHEAAEER